MSETLTDEAMWTMVRARRPASFFVGVATTGVFCRTGCPARTPRRENVRFFGAASEAVAAGFRPCLRCRPLGTDPVTESAVQAARAIEAAPERRWTGAELAKVTGLGVKASLGRFETVMGVSPRSFRDAVRLRRYKSELRGGESATMAGLEAGYGGEAQRHEGTRALGMSSTAYARGGAGERIAYVVADTPLGSMIVAATAKGVCLLQLADDEAAALAKLHEEFPAAEHVREEHVHEEQGRVAGFAAVVDAFLEGDGPRPDLPLDLRGTAFQLKVWAALSAIPPGQTPTYGELAARIGHPKASRAVGSANGRNPVAVVVPCHLVVASGGKLGGYAGGLERKRKLLALESSLVEG